MASYSQDTFADTAGVDLLDHVGQLDASWSRHPFQAAGSTNFWKFSDSGRVYSPAQAYSTALYLVSGVPAGAEYDVLSTWHFLTNLSDAQVGIAFKYDPTANSGYRLIYETYTDFQRWTLQKWTAGSAEVLGTSYSQVLSAGTDYDVRIEARNAGITIKIDGVSRITSSDTTYTAAGRVGLVSISDNGASNSTGMHCDAIAIGSAGFTIPQYTLTGPAEGAPGAPSRFTVTLEDGVNPGSVTITPAATTVAGTFSPTSVTLADADRTNTFDFTPGLTVAVGTISVTDSGSLVDPPALDFESLYGPPARLASWETRIKYTHSTGASPFTPESAIGLDAALHYDAGRCIFLAEDYCVRNGVGPQDWSAEMAAVTENYRAIVLDPANQSGGVSSLLWHHRKTWGPSQHFRDTGESEDFDVVAALASGMDDVAAKFESDNSSIDSVRPVAFMLLSMLDREWMGMGEHANVDTAARCILNMCAMWLAPAGTYYGVWTKPWMTALAMRALIAYRDRYRDASTGARGAIISEIPDAVKDVLQYIHDECWFPPGTDGGDGWMVGACKYQVPDWSTQPPITGLTVGTVADVQHFIATGPGLSSVDDYYKYCKVVFDGVADFFPILGYDGTTKEITFGYYYHGPIAPGAGFEIRSSIESGSGPGPTPALNQMVAPAFAWAYWHTRVIQADVAGSLIWRHYHDEWFDGGTMSWQNPSTIKEWNQVFWWTTMGLDWRDRGDNEWDDATTFTLQAPVTGASGDAAVESGPFRLSLAHGVKADAPINVAVSCSTALGAFTPASPVLTADRRWSMATFTPDVADDTASVDVSATATGLTPPSAVAYQVGTASTTPAGYLMYALPSGAILFIPTDNVEPPGEPAPVSVSAYGAVGDGIADDAPAIREAIAANPGGTILVPAGEYRIGTSIGLGADNTTLKGVGPSSVLRLTDDCRQALIAIPVPYLEGFDTSFRVSGLTIEDLTLDGNHNGFGTAEGGDYFAIFCRQAENLTIRRVWVRDWVSDGITFSNGYMPSTGVLIELSRLTTRRNGIHIGFADGFTIRKNIITETPDQWWGRSAAHSVDCEVEGYDLYGSEHHRPYVRNGLIEDNIFLRTASATSSNGVAMQPAYGPLSDVVIRRNVVSGHQAAFETTGSLALYDGEDGVHDLTIQDNWLTCDPAFAVAGNAITLLGCSGVTISGNVVNDGTNGAFSGSAVLVVGAADVAITGNTFHLWFAQISFIAHVYGGSDSVSVTGNSYRTFEEVVYDVDDATNVTESGNTPLDTGTWDRIAPVVSFPIADAGRAILGGITTITPTVVEDDSSVARVFFFVDGIPAGHSDAAPFTFSYDPADYTPGEHTLSARAIDSSANLGPETAIEVIAESDLMRVLRLADGAHVDHGRFWPEGETMVDDLGPFLWDAWVIHRGAEYLISDGYGGGHALLWGFSGDGGTMTGNVRDDDSNVSFGGAYVPGPVEWVHVAVGWDGTNRIACYVNGILDGLAPFPGPRRAITWGTGGGGHLYVGGSDHSNGDYDLALLRGFEGVNPHVPMARPFIPERHPSRITSLSEPCSFYCDYPSNAGGNVAFDTSPRGHTTVAADGPVFHHGRLNNASVNGLGDAYTANQASAPLPEWVVDDTCPLGKILGSSPVPTEPARTPASAPTGCLVYDSFGRANRTLAFQDTPSLGSTEGGSLSTLTWVVSRLGGQAVFGHFGILGGQAVCTADGTVLARVPLGTADHDVRAKRSMHARQCGEVGVAFRVVDANNWWAAYFSATEFFSTHGASRSTGILYYVKVTAGTVGAPTGIAIDNDTWTHLRVTAVGNVITFLTGDGASSWTQVGQITDAAHNTGQGGGITNLNANVDTVNTLARWDDFAAFAAS